MKTYKIIKIGEKNNIHYYNGDVLELIEFLPNEKYIRDGYYPSEFASNLSNDKNFGNKLVDTFLIDNRESPIAFNPQLSISVLQKFQGVKALAEVGDIKNVMLMLNYIEVDELFTQERKDKYILMCQNHLG